MNFNITEEQQLLMESIQQFMERYAPESEVKKWYENHHVPTEVSKAFVEAGFGFLGVPEEYGGTPCDMVTLMMFAKEISRLTAGTMPFMSNILNMYDMLLLGTPEQIKMALDSYVETGESCFSLAISEPQAGSDNSSMTTTAKRVGDKIILNGTKTFVTHGDVSPMTIIVAKEEDPSRENKRMSMYMVPLNTKGISTSRLHKIGQGTTAFCEMYIDNVECDDSCLVGECGKGFLQLMQNFEIERLLICAQALGLAEAAMEDAAKYAAQRVQFNQPIYKFQQIQQMLTDMEIKIVNIEQAEKLMYEDTVDFISMVRPLVADPYLMNKAAAGRYSEIRPCVGCNQGCLDHIMRHKPITCLVNAEVGREAEVMRGGKLPVESASTAPERILVVGAGPAGMEFARIAASRGHGVTIWEEKDHLGGQFDLNSVPPGRHDFARFRNYLAAEMARLGVTVVTGKKADAGEIEALVSDGSFDRVVIATGAKPICPPIPVEEGCSVVQAWDVLLKKAELGKNVVIVGGGAVGVETAEYIAEMGTLDPQVLRFLMLYKAEAPETLYKQLVTGTKKVTVIEMQPKIGRDIGITTRWGMLQRLKMYGVTTLAGTKVLSVEKAGVRVQQGDGTQAVIPADTVVLAVGSRSENALYGALEGRVRKLTLIGDAEKPAFILDAVRAAYDAAIEI